MDAYVWDKRLGEVRQAEGVLEAAAMMEDGASRRVALWEQDGVRVSTVFLVYDHAFGEGPPVLWETMVFWGGHEMDCEGQRYCSHAEAVAGHAAMVERVKAAMKGEG